MDVAVTEVSCLSCGIKGACEPNFGCGVSLINSEMAKVCRLSLIFIYKVASCMLLNAESTVCYY